MVPESVLPRTMAEVTPPWLTGMLRAAGCLNGAKVVSVEAQVIGQQVGFLDGLARLRLTYDLDEVGAPPSVVVKIPAGESTYRDIGNRYHAYEREIRFYAEVAPRSPLRLPRCYFRGMDRAADVYLLVMEDLGSLTAGSQVDGLSPAQALSAVETIARLHARWWETPDVETPEWMPLRNIRPERYHQFWPRFRETVGPHLPAPALALGEKLGIHIDTLLRVMEERPHTIVHSDFRADNLLFDESSGPDPVVVVDWQLAIRGRGVMDVARLLCGSLAPADRAACEMSAIRRWHETLEAGGVKGYSFAEALQDYRRGALLCLYYPVTIHEVEEHAGKRGVALAHAQIERFFSAALDLDAASVLPK